MAVSLLELKQIIPRTERGKDSDIYVEHPPALRIGAAWLAVAAGGAAICRTRFAQRPITPMQRITSGAL